MTDIQVAGKIVELEITELSTVRYTKGLKRGSRDARTQLTIGDRFVIAQVSLELVALSLDPAGYAAWEKSASLEALLLELGASEAEITAATTTAFGVAHTRPA